MTDSQTKRGSARPVSRLRDERRGHTHDERERDETSEAERLSLFRCFALLLMKRSLQRDKTSSRRDKTSSRGSDTRARRETKTRDEGPGRAWRARARPGRARARRAAPSVSSRRRPRTRRTGRPNARIPETRASETVVEGERTRGERGAAHIELRVHSELSFLLGDALVRERAHVSLRRRDAASGLERRRLDRAVCRLRCLNRAQLG